MKHLPIFTLLVLVSCGPKIEKASIYNGKDGGSCHTSQLANGSLISCDDGSSSYILNGSDGIEGVSGQDCFVEEDDLGANIICGDDSVLLKDGEAGSPGQVGQGCSLVPSISGGVITCGTVSTTITHGTNGLPGNCNLVSAGLPDNKKFHIICGSLKVLINVNDIISQ